MSAQVGDGGVVFVVGFLLGAVVTMAFFVSVTLKLERNVDQLSRDIKRFQQRLTEFVDTSHSGVK